MRLGRRSAFAEVVDVQLDLFVADEAGLLRDCEAALGAYDAASGAEAEERYSAYLALVETVGERLELLREGYAATLDGPVAEAYRLAFDAAARRRLPRYAVELE